MYRPDAHLQRRGTQAGFTLVEVLVAVIILGLAAVTLASAFGGSANGFSRIHERTRAWLIASDKLVELQVYQQWPGIGTQDDRREAEGREWKVRTTVSNGPYPDTRRVDIDVGPMPAQGEDFYVTYRQTSLLGKPFAGSAGAAGTGTGSGTGTGAGTGSGSGTGGGNAP